MAYWGDIAINPKIFLKNVGLICLVKPIINIYKILLISSENKIVPTLVLYLFTIDKWFNRNRDHSYSVLDNTAEF